MYVKGKSRLKSFLAALQPGSGMDHPNVSRVHTLYQHICSLKATVVKAFIIHLICSGSVAHLHINSFGRRILALHHDFLSMSLVSRVSITNDFTKSRSQS